MWWGLEGRGLQKKKTYAEDNKSIDREQEGSARAKKTKNKSIDRASKQVGHGRRNSERAAGGRWTQCTPNPYKYVYVYGYVYMYMYMYEGM